MGISDNQLFDEQTAQKVASEFDIKKLSPDFYVNPYRYYAALQEYEPIKIMPDGGIFLTRYEDLVQVYKDPALFSSDKKVEFKPKFGDSELYEHHTTSLVFNDPPLHTRVRRIISGALTPRAIKDLEPGLISLVDGLLDNMDAKMKSAGEVDLIEDFASAIPVDIIGNLLNVPVADRGPLRQWSLDILGALEPVLSQQELDEGNKAVRDFVAYLKGLVAERRKNPGDPARDVLTRLIQGEEDGEKLTEIELLQNCIFLLNAGHETTANFIGNALVTLTEWPEQRRLLVENPDLTRNALEEFLRFENSIQLNNRKATADTEIGGEPIKEGTEITLCIGAANRDPEIFKDPHKLDITRRPNRNLAFGTGVHTCVGLSLARLEGLVGISYLLARFPEYELSADPVLGGRARFRGYLKIPAKLYK